MKTAFFRGVRRAAGLRRRPVVLGFALGGATLTTAGLAWTAEKRDCGNLTESWKRAAGFEPQSGTCPRITLAQMQNMVEDEGRFVVSYKGDVFDVTNFTGHPGGYGRLEMASGNDLEPFWRVYTQHNRGHVVKLLQRYKIGTLSPEEAEEIKNRTIFDNPYTNDPPTYDTLLTNTRHPYNAEGKLRELTDSWITPIGRHFVRNHGLVPDVDPDTYSLLVTGSGVDETVFTLDQLKAMPRVDVTTVIQCNGNRREDYHYVKEGQPAFGPPHWVAGAIGNSTWTGVRLRDVLRASGMDVDAISLRSKLPPKGASHIGLKGLDHDECGNQYCCSFPFDKGVDPYGDVILAYEMNGEAIPRSHGYPLRAIVPGHAGARNCKFLERVTVTDDPCLDAGNWKQYSVHAMDTPLFKLAEFERHRKELKADPAVQEMPVQSLITYPGAGDTLAITEDTKTIPVVGLAWGGAGSGINRVDVSLDAGENFTKADVVDPPIQEPRRSQWSWRFFKKDVPLTEDMRARLLRGEKVEVELCSKALNASWNVQPESAEANINPHGCCVNHWYRVPVVLDPSAKEDRRAPEGDFANKPCGGKFATPFTNMEQPR